MRDDRSWVRQPSMIDILVPRSIPYCAGVVLLFKWRDLLWSSALISILFYSILVLSLFVYCISLMFSFRVALTFDPIFNRVTFVALRRPTDTFEWASKAISMQCSIPPLLCRLSDNTRLPSVVNWSTSALKKKQVHSSFSFYLDAVSPVSCLKCVEIACDRYWDARRMEKDEYRGTDTLVRKAAKIVSTFIVACHIL